MSDPETAPEDRLSDASDTPQTSLPAATVQAATLTNAAARLDDIWPETVAAWLADRIHNSPVARATDALNHLAEALPALRQALVEKL